MLEHYQKILQNKISDHFLSSVLLIGQSEGEIRDESNVIFSELPEKITISLDGFAELQRQVQSRLSQFTVSEPDANTIVYQPPENFLARETDVDLLATSLDGNISDHILYVGTDGIIGPAIYSDDAEAKQDLKYLCRLFTRELGIFGFLRYKLLKQFTDHNQISPQRTIDVGIPLITRQQKNYGHWLIETLPKVRRANLYQRETNKKPTLIVPENLSEFQRRTLELLGCTENDWESVGNWPVRVNEFVLTDIKNLNSADYSFCPADIRWISHTMKSNVNLTSSNYSERIFISRQGMNQRHILNYAEVEKLLSEHGFTTVRPEKLSVDEQIAIFDQAEIIVGGHASAYSNLIFSQDISVVCLYPPGWVSGNFFILAQIFDHDWIPVHSENIEGELKKRKHLRDISVDIELLEETIRKTAAGY